MAKHLGDSGPRRLPRGSGRRGLGRRGWRGWRWRGWRWRGWRWRDWRWRGWASMVFAVVSLVTVATVVHGIGQPSPRQWQASDLTASSVPPGHRIDVSRGSNRAGPGIYRVLPGKRLSLRPVVLAARRMARTPTVFRVSTFNLLGASHTGVGGNHHGYATGARRMVGAVELLRGLDVDVVGFQEMEPVQYSTFMRLTGGAWGAYPGPTLDRGSIRQSIAWRLDQWTLVKANSIAIPYFHGQQIRMPVVLLRNRASGEDVWFANFHNPATTRQHGNNQFWRTVAEGRQVDLVRQLEATSDDPVVITGDMNERGEYFAHLAGQTDMCPANALVTSPGVCSMPRHMDVDWIFGSPQITFSDYVSNRDALVRRTTDHPIVASTGTMAPASARR